MEIEKEIKSINIDNFEDFDIISEKILNLLRNWGALPYETIATHLGYPSWVIWTILKKLKLIKKVKIETGDWSLYD